MHDGTDRQTTPSLPATFFEILDRQVALSEAMLDLLAEERSALRNMEMQALISLSRRKERLLARIQDQDQALQELVARSAGREGKRPVSLSAVIPLASPAEQPRLAALREKLLALREEILARNMVNKHFAEDTRGYLNDAISFITRAIADQPLYSRRQQSAPSSRRPSLISREV